MRASLLLVAALVVGCTGAPAASTARAAHPNPEAVSTLDAGRVESLPTGPVYVRFIGFAQPPGHIINSKQHVPSIVYVESGAQRLTLMGQPPLDLAPGQAKFHQSVTHTHLNPGPGDSYWYSIAVWPSSGRGQPLVDAVARAAFESQDIDPSVLPQVAYSEVLRRVALGGGQDSGPHRFGGVIAFYVIEGALAIRSARGAASVLAAGQGAAYLPGTVIEEANAGAMPAEYLEFIATPVGTDFEVPVTQLG